MEPKPAHFRRYAPEIGLCGGSVPHRDRMATTEVPSKRKIFAH
jgi:hypothetical protein